MSDGFKPAFVAWLAVQRKRGRKRCRAYGVGAMRDELIAMIPANGTGMYIAEAKADLQLVESVCRACGRCPDICGPQ